MAWTPPNAGALRDRVRIERREEVVDAFGNPQMGWATVVASAPAMIAPRRGGETVQAARLEGQGEYEITIRKSKATAAITPNDRAVDVRSGRTFNIAWAESLDAERRFVIIMAKSGGAD